MRSICGSSSPSLPIIISRAAHFNTLKGTREGIERKRGTGAEPPLFFPMREEGLLRKKSSGNERSGGAHFRSGATQGETGGRLLLLLSSKVDTPPGECFLFRSGAAFFRLSSLSSFWKVSHTERPKFLSFAVMKVPSFFKKNMRSCFSQHALRVQQILISRRKRRKRERGKVHVISGPLHASFSG